MKTKTLLLILLTVFVSAQVIQAQDQIHKKTGEIIICKVKEIGLDEVKYYQTNGTNDILYSISKDKISRVVLANGEEIEIPKARKYFSTCRDEKQFKVIGQPKIPPEKPDFRGNFWRT